MLLPAFTLRMRVVTPLSLPQRPQPTQKELLNLYLFLLLGFVSMQRARSVSLRFICRIQRF